MSEQPTGWGAEQLPSTRTEATDAFMGALVRLEQAPPLDGEGLAQSRRWLKQLRKWESLEPRTRSGVWVGVQRFLQARSSGAILPTRPDTSPSRDVPLKSLDELRSSQLEAVALRVKVAALLASGHTPADVLTRLAAEDGVTRSRAWVYKIKARADGGDVGMDDRRTGNRRPREIPVAASHLVEDCQLAMASRPTIAGIHRYVCDQLSPGHQRTPSRSWVRKELRTRPQQELFRRMGADVHRRQGRAADPTGDALVAPGQIYEVDSTELDLWIRVPDQRGTPTAVRPWLTVVLDVGSRAIVGMHLTIGAVSEASVMHALVHALLPKPDPAWTMAGSPRTLRCDRGSEYGRRAKAALGALGIAVSQGPPGYPNARAKVERFFLTLREYLVGIDGATAALGTASEDVERALAVLLTPASLLGRLENWITRDYHARRHAGINDVPLVVWARGTMAAEVTPAQVRVLLPNERELKVKHGQIQVQDGNHRHTLTGPALVDYPEQRIRIRWGATLEHVALFDIASNRYLGDAVSTRHPHAQEYGEALRKLRAEGGAADRALRAAHHRRTRMAASVSSKVATVLAHSPPVNAETPHPPMPASASKATRDRLRQYLRTGVPGGAS